jgi:hypothetical protein
MKVARELAIFRDLDRYCGRHGDFATALNAASICDLSGATLVRDHRLVLLGWGA